MKRILIACFLLTATCSVTFVQQAVAHAAPAGSVSSAAYTAKINLLDAQIGAGNMTAAQATWNEVHTMLLDLLHDTKLSIQSAATPAERDTQMTKHNNQYGMYTEIWNLKPDLATNRAAIHTKLVAFGATI